MYIPKHFEEPRVEILHELIRAHPLAALVTLTPEGLDANHLPFEIDPEPAPFGTLRAHMARANSFWRDFSREVQALAIFQGPQTYISPSWYPTKQETGRVVPTWNYAVVHAHGPLRVIEDRGWLRQFVERLTTRHEASRSQPWKVLDAPADYIDKQLGAIVGVEMPITRLIGKWKASQNRPARDQDGVIEGLLQEGRESATAMAGLIRQSRNA
ncbi:MAG TPA: FMN-binding negative transcriptional regulator [Candidatus Tectomicrobia bacterium]|nr:FMN-binding negative transcriptional regulator [Candidatus Tectomicrobia bacterium]